MTKNTKLKFLLKQFKQKLYNSLKNCVGIYLGSYKDTIAFNIILKT